MILGNGANQNSVVISLYLAWNRPFTILLDSDKAGVTAKKLYIKQFGKIVESYIYTYNEVAPETGKVAMEDIFTHDEKIFITKHFRQEETKFDKSKFNTAIQNLYMENKPIELSESTISKFAKLLAGLQQNKK